MAEKQSKIEIQLRLLKVQETGFFMDSVLISSITENKPDLFNIEFGLNIVPDVNKNTLNLHLIVRYLLSDGTKVIELTTSNNFEILHLQDLMSINDSDITDNNGIIPTILGVALGT